MRGEVQDHSLLPTDSTPAASQPPETSWEKNDQDIRGHEHAEDSKVWNQNLLAVYGKFSLGFDKKENKPEEIGAPNLQINTQVTVSLKKKKEKQETR